MKNKIVIMALLLVAVFLLGFFPWYVKAQRLQNELIEARREQSLAQLRELSSLAYFQANQKDYGIAAGTATRFFDHAQVAANDASDAAAKRSLEALLSLRDPITAALAKGDAGVLGDLQVLFVKTREATGAPSGSPQPH